MQKNREMELKNIAAILNSGPTPEQVFRISFWLQGTAERWMQEDCWRERDEADEQTWYDLVERKK